MKWFGFLLFMLTIGHLAISTIISLDILHAKPFNKFPKIINVLFTWLIPYYWNYHVWKSIRKMRVVDPKVKNTPLWEVLLTTGAFNPFDFFK